MTKPISQYGVQANALNDDMTSSLELSAAYPNPITPLKLSVSQLMTLRWNLSEEVLQVEQGSLYPALHRLIGREWISAEEGVSENNRRAKFYALTPAGQKQLGTELEDWERLSGAIGLVLGRITEASS